MLPKSINENGQLFKGEELIADVSCQISVQKTGLLEWNGTMERPLLKNLGPL